MPVDLPTGDQTFRLQDATLVILSETMGEQPESKIQLKAEQAIRHSEGDKTQALETLEDWVGGDPSLRDSVLKRALRRELSDASQRQRAEPKKCPFCAEQISADALKCKHCGEWLEPRTGGSKKVAQESSLVASRVWYFVLFTAWTLILVVAAMIYTLFT